MSAATAVVLPRHHESVVVPLKGGAAVDGYFDPAAVGHARTDATTDAAVSVDDGPRVDGARVESSTSTAVRE